LSLESAPDEVDDEKELGETDDESRNADENIDAANSILREELELVKSVVSSRELP
jgi:hypothetical protein